MLSASQMAYRNDLVGHTITQLSAAYDHYLIGAGSDPDHDPLPGPVPAHLAGESCCLPSNFSA